MADSDIQALLDVGATGRGIRIVRRDPDTGSPALSHYYCEGNVTGVGKAMWVSVTASDSDAQKDAAIRAAFGVA
jgi:hypothetical protein